MYALDLEEYKNGEQDTKCLRTFLVWQVILISVGGEEIRRIFEPTICGAQITTISWRYAVPEVNSKR